VRGNPLNQLRLLAAKTLLTQIHIGREFVEGADGVPRLGPAVPQWFGETIGFGLRSRYRPCRNIAAQTATAQAVTRPSIMERG
jgi:hypothetical protein